MRMLFFLCALALALDVSSAENGTNLIFLQIIFRHGDRAPLISYPNDPNPKHVWPEGLGKLTKLGKKQQYVLGKFIRSLYKDFISTDPNEVSAASSESDRCIRSAQSHLAGLYEPDSDWTFHESIKWQPIPVNYMPKAQDKSLSYGYKCPRVDEEVRKLANKMDEKMKTTHKDMFEHLTVNSGYNVTKSLDALYLFDALLIQKMYNLTVPDWAEIYWKELEKIMHNFFFERFSAPIIYRLRTGPLLERLSDMMTKKMEGNLPKQKVQIYSTHDLIMALLQSALGLSNGKRPPYSSTLLLELHEDSDHEKLIRLLYLNSTTPELGHQEIHVLELDGCSEFCPFDYFKNFTKHLIPEDLELECRSNQTDAENFLDSVFKKRI